MKSSLPPRLMGYSKILQLTQYFRQEGALSTSPILVSLHLFSYVLFINSRCSYWSHRKQKEHLYRYQFTFFCLGTSIFRSIAVLVAVQISLHVRAVRKKDHYVTHPWENANGTTVGILIEVVYTAPVSKRRFKMWMTYTWPICPRLTVFNRLVKTADLDSFSRWEI